MSRRIVAALGVVLLLFSLSLGADAVEGSIRIDLRGGGRPISGAQIRVYCVGIPISGGFRLTDAFGGGIITELEVLSPELAVWLSQRATGGWKETTDREGSATFRGLGEGLYLVTQTGSRGGYLPFAPFLITVPWDGVQWDIVATPKTEREITVIPDTSDPGKLDRGLTGMALSGVGLLTMILTRRKWIP